ncbi:MAG: hypothetical protein OHK0023_10490 [Anaerolineae bacterium]
MVLSLDRQNHYRALYRKRNPHWSPATEVYESIIRGILLPQMRVLDVGCGRGGVLEQLGAAINTPFGVDPDLSSLREHRIPTLPRAVALAHRLPFANESFDLILASWVFEHLETPQTTLNELHRVLKANGRIVFITPNARSLVVWLNRVLKPLQKWLVPRLYGRSEADTFPVRYRANDSHQLKLLSERDKLELETLRYIPDPSYLAFTPVLYRFSLFLAKITPPVHLVGVMRRCD